MKKIVFYIPFFYPDENRFYQILDLFADRGVDYVEIGLPAEDPYMDGEAIARAHAAVLREKYGKEKYLAALAEIKKRYPFRVVLMGYYQDFKRFPDFWSAPDTYFDATLCVDLPPEKEAGGNIPIFNEESSRAEIREKLKNKPLFAYVMSSVGKTGSGQLRDHYVETIKRVKEKQEVECCVGFQIRTTADVRRVLAGGADGAIIGSELLMQVEKGLDAAEDYVSDICRAREEIQ